MKANKIKNKSKKFTALILLFGMICFSFAALSSCGGSEPINIELIDLMDYLLSQEDLNLDDFIAISSEKMQNDYNINEENSKQAVILVSLNITSSEELIFVEAAGADELKAITNTLKQRKVDALNGLRDYTLNPDNERQYYIVDGSKIVTNGNYIFWVVHENRTEINKLVDDYIKENKQ